MTQEQHTGEAKEAMAVGAMPSAEEPVSLLMQGFVCASCRFAHYWSEQRTRRIEVHPSQLWRDATYRTETYEAEGIQCIRYPTPIDTQADHGCGEYYPAQPPTTPQGEDAQQALSAGGGE